MIALADGEAVELTGTTRLLGEPLIAPLTGEPCLAHVSRARVFTRLDFVGDLVEEFEIADAALFVLETAHGEVLVVDKPKLVLAPLHLESLDEGRLAAFLRPRTLERYVRSTFFEHATIHEGAAVTLTGVITHEPAPVLEAGFRDLPVRTRLTGYGKHPLTLRA
jgi:hypothetical protein